MGGLKRLSARRKSADAELPKFGETYEMAIPSQAQLWEGVKTRRAAPNAATPRWGDSPDHERDLGGGESRSGMKIRRAKARAGSSPAARTIGIAPFQQCIEELAFRHH